MSKLYSVDVWVCATAYVKAESGAEALRKVKELDGEGLEVSGDQLISPLDFDHPDLPAISLSPAMTVHTPIKRSLDLVDD